MNREELFEEIINSKPQNEAEVETKILLNIFKLLDFTYLDRADKQQVQMYFGRERKLKVADFILYNGTDRSVNSALMSVEAKRLDESIEDAENQVKSYSAWAGTPYYLVCNGKELLISRYNPHAIDIEKVRIEINDICEEFDAVYSFANKTEIILNKERIDFINTYFPEIENLHPVDFFKEYLNRFRNRFSYHKKILSPLTPDSGDFIELPVNVIVNDNEYDIEQLANSIIHNNLSLLIEGEPGSGKTTLCSRLALFIVEQILANSMNTIPILISLREKVPSSSFSAFKHSCDQLGVRVFENIYKKKIDELNLIIILDGLDEVVDIDGGSRGLNRLLEENNIHSIIITSRPHVLSNINLTSNKVALANISKLKRSDVFNIANKYNIDSYDALNNASLDLTSPLQLLMYIKLKIEGYIDSNTTLFNLYIRYIKVLTKYYNNIDDKGYLNKILKTLFIISSEVIQSNRSGQRITVNNLFGIIDEQNLKYLSDLLRCGLITSQGGNVTFLHKSFEEFGIAYGMLQSIKSCNEEALKHLSLNSDNSYKMASSEIQNDNFKNLLLLLESKSNRVRKRVIGIIKYSNIKNVQIYSRLIELLKVEKSEKVKKSIYRILLQVDDEEILLELLCFNNIKKSKKEGFLKSIDKSESLKGLFKLIEADMEKYYGMNLSYWILLLVQRSYSVGFSYLDQLSSLIANENNVNKSQIFSLITRNEFRDYTDFMELLIRHIYPKLNSWKDILQLFHKDLESVHEYPDFQIDYIFERLMSIEKIGVNDYRRLKDIFDKSKLNSLYKDSIEIIVRRNNYDFGIKPIRLLP